MKVVAMQIRPKEISISRELLASMIDHTALKPETTSDQIKDLCKDAEEFGFGTVCIAPCWVPLAKQVLSGQAARICTVIGFPHGNTLPEVKSFEARTAIKSSAQELDMVVNIGFLKSGDTSAVLEDIKGVVSAAKEYPDKVVKVILECYLLSDSEIEIGCRLAEEAGADFVKTSTGFIAGGGATIEDVRRMRGVVGDRLGVKAAGGIKDTKFALDLIDAGANRLGCSSSVNLINGL